jgi:cardiolipin synthase
MKGTIAKGGTWRFCGFVLAVILAGLVLGTLLPTRAATASSTGLRLIIEPNAGITPIYQLLSSAQLHIDVVIYELADPRAETILADDAARGVRVRVLLDKEYEASANAAAYSYLTAHGVTVRWASSRYALTHEKAVVVDDRTAAIMTLNLVAADYASTRDFAVTDSQPADVAAIETVFSHDWSNTTGAAPRGTDLVWSPGAEQSLVGLIDSAKRCLLIENEEMDDRYITTPLAAAARRGIQVEVVMTDSSSWSSAFTTLERAGVKVRTYAPSAPLYIHAKVIVADAGTGAARVFVGSQNFSIESLVYNRELGLITSNPTIVTEVAGVVRDDFAAATPWAA